MDDLTRDELLKKLEALRAEHRNLDTLIAQMKETDHYNQIQLQRFKKRKLQFKDEIAWMENNLLPDIIA